jgi:hypothetical protein
MPLDAMHDRSCKQDIQACDCRAGDSTPVCKTLHQRDKSAMQSKAGLQTNHAADATPQEPGPRAGDLQVGPADLGSLFAKRPLILGEDANDYDELLSRVTAAAKPTDAIEALWIKDVVDLTWEAQRLRRLKASLLMKAGQQALTKLLLKSRSTGQASGGRGPTVPDLVSAYATGDPAAVADVEQILKGGAQDADSLMAQALAEHLDDVERIDRLIAGADARRNRSLNELERRRDALARRLRRAAEDIAEVQHS